MRRLLGDTMRRIAGLGLVVVTVLGLAGPAAAQAFTFLGRTVFHNNDVFLDGDDRWQTGGSNWSVMFGPEGTRGLPGSPGQVWELRLRGQVITPDTFTAPAPWDRRAAGIITTTLHSHFQQGGVEVSAGAGLAITGPQTHMIALQNFIHDLTPANDPKVPGAVQAAQIPNAVYPTLLAEAAYRVPLADDITLRPFVEVQGGVETYLRAGADLFFGGAWDGGILARDGTTGFAYQTLKGAAPRGFAFVMGADAAYVAQSALLPPPAYRLSPLRLRARAGLHYEGKHAAAFGGLAWLGREFAAQPSGQVVTAFQLQWRF